jgi:hypothetical protein
MNQPFRSHCTGTDLNYLLDKSNTNHLNGGDKMAYNSVQDYWDDDDRGHVDTRENNFKCESPDERLGCDLGIDVQG